MESYRNLLATVPYGGFTSGFFVGQKFGEVDPEFASEFKSELRSSWKLVGSNDKIHTDVLEKPYLNIFCAFEDYLTGLKLGRITACCDNGSVTVFYVSSTLFPFKMTAIGLGWKEFCEANNFSVGDALCFKFVVLKSSNIARGFKLEE
ncbi:hypothetical protein TSUD_220300 [Trifolium subterraneum]|uniref:TF-B3 domain-containing protein n=1 Tax=Trifolium subterraneum TaxID=3900 RepID=A0A2Z6NV12_TRISU|nr:hypothetical protein TSUD_220300 [Trifolium subterraneum]